MRSSWSGAMGLGQFIPSSYNSYGVDYNYDGVVDLMDSREDGIASVANYLKVMDGSMMLSQLKKLKLKTESLHYQNFRLTNLYCLTE